MSFLAAVDIGTTLIKAGIVAEDGRLAGMAAQPFELVSPREGWFELGPESYWGSIRAALRSAIANAGVEAADVCAIGLSSQGQTVMPADDAGRPLDRFIVWLDKRAAGEAAEIEARFGAEAIYRETGVSRLTPGHTVSVILWWKRNRPEVFAEAARFLLTKDYLVLRMTGQAAIDRQLAGSTGCYSALRDGWWEDALEFIGVAPERFGTLVGAATVGGGLTREAARDLGLAPGCPVAVGTWDQIAGGTGAGNVRPGGVTEMTGSCLATFATCERFITDPKRRMLAGRHVVGEHGYLLPYTEVAGKALQRVRDSCYGCAACYDVMSEEASHVPIGCDGLALDLDRVGTIPDVRDAFVGLSSRHTRSHMARAAMEAVAFALKDHVDAMEDLGVRVDNVIALGGGARSDVWLQMKADLLGVPVKRPAYTEAALVGAAILAGTGCGLFRDVAETSQRLAARIERVFTPDVAARDPYLAAHCLSRASRRPCRSPRCPPRPRP